MGQNNFSLIPDKETLEKLTFAEKIILGLKISFKKLVEQKKLTNGSFAFSENGKIIKVKAIDIK
jgi:hypothetical protein